MNDGAIIGNTTTNGWGGGVNMSAGGGSFTMTGGVNDGAAKDGIMVAAGGNAEAIDMRALEIAVREGDAFAVSVWDEMMERNAQAMGALMNIFNPSVIALGTIAVHCGDLFMKPLMERITKYSWPQMQCDIVPSKLGSKAGEYSGIAVALYSLYERGEWTLPWSK